MERIVQNDPAAYEPLPVDLEQGCLHCGQPVRERPRGCKSGHCPNCRHPYPLGDCSD